MDLIPGLPKDIAIECLIRMPYQYFSTVSSVSNSWKLEMDLPEFWQRRKAAKISQSLLVCVQARLGPSTTNSVIKHPAPPTYMLTVCDLETGNWSELPPVPCYESGLPLFCRLAAVGSKLVLIGGWDPATWEASKLVFVYDFLENKWRPGSDMPGPVRSFFGCASDLYRTLVVAGGHDRQKNALKSAFLYDVEKDTWTPLADMARERDECSMILHGDKFHVIGGYSTEMQGRFEKSAELFDSTTMQWEPVDEDFLVSGRCPRTCIGGGGQKLYMCREANIVVLENSVWRFVTELPKNVCNSTLMMAWQGNIVVIGSSRFGERHQTYMFEIKQHMWRKILMPTEYSGHVQSGCLLEV